MSDQMLHGRPSHGAAAELNGYVFGQGQINVCKNFFSNSSQSIHPAKVFLFNGRVIYLYSLLRQLIYHSRFAGRHEAATPPGFWYNEEMKYHGGVGTRGSKV